MTVWSKVASFVDKHGSAAMITMLRVKGSSPREAGARIVVAPNGNFTGTIGGGTLEWDCLKKAQSQLENGASYNVQTYALGPSLGQCCGGSVDVLIECFSTEQRAEIEALKKAEDEGAFSTKTELNGIRALRTFADTPGSTPLEYSDNGQFFETFGEIPTPLYLFGAGHVAKALMLSLAPLPFMVHWLDERTDMFPSHVPANFKCDVTAQPELVLDEAPAGSMVLIMTHNHDLDFSLCHKALTLGRFAYVGVIGSETKGSRFRSRLNKLGCDTETIGALRCPIGFDGITGKDPASIAVSVTTELLMKRESLHA